MSSLNFIFIVKLIILILATCNFSSCDVLESTVSESSVNTNGKHAAAAESLTTEKLTTESNVDETIRIESSTTSTKITAAEVRMVTKEELAMHDGKQTPTVWLSIMSKVFDVSAGPEYYSENGPYRVFVARDGNVPFVTGVFNPEEAAKPLSSLEPHELSNLEHWLQFYVDEEKYPFVGLLEGDLYDKDGSKTEEMKLIEDKIAIVKANVENRQKKTANIIERRKREDEERKEAKKKKQEIFEEMKKQKIIEEKLIWLPNQLLSYISQLIQGKRGRTSINTEL